MERFQELFGSFGPLCTFVEAEANIPADTHLVILNAYSISFQNNVVDTLHDNCLPILDLLEQCTHLTHLKRAVFVSTAYVQPYLPVKPCFCFLQCTYLYLHCTPFFISSPTYFLLYAHMMAAL